jgi:hypothetical protein
LFLEWQRLAAARGSELIALRSMLIQIGAIVIQIGPIQV